VDIDGTGSGLRPASFSYACVNCDTHRTRESAYAAKRYLPRLVPVANGGFFLDRGGGRPVADRH
jgi:hypothetical protein